MYSQSYLKALARIDKDRDRIAREREGKGDGTPPDCRYGLLVMPLSLAQYKNSNYAIRN